MILKQDFETLVNTQGVKNCNMANLLEQSRELTKHWKNYIVDNENGVNFQIDEEQRFNYLTEQGERRSGDISEFAFQQLCTRLGVPASYVKKCFQTGKVSLALDNFHAWAGDMDKKILVREHDGEVRAVLSEDYSPYDSFKVLKALNNTVDNKIYEPSQMFLSTDRLHVRFVNHNPLPIDNDNSPLYAGFTVDSSDVGRGSLNMKFFIYRFACRNGLVISKIGGTLFRQNHIGSKIEGGKLELFNRALLNIDKLSGQAVELIHENKKTLLKDYELEMYLEKVKREMKLSEKGQDKLRELIDSTYDHSKWGIISGITELAQDYTLDTRIKMENWAGDLFAEAA